MKFLKLWACSFILGLVSTSAMSDIYGGHYFENVTSPSTNDFVTSLIVGFILASVLTWETSHGKI